MIAMPYEEYAQMSGSAIKHVKQPEDQEFYALERRYNTQGDIRDPYKRMYLQGETLDEMKELKERMRNSIMRNSPTPYRGRAKALFEGVSSFLKFNQRGEIYDDENQVVPDSHVEDLIQYAVRDRRRRDIKPAGWPQFTTLLRKHNVPRYTLNRYTLDEIEGIPQPTFSKTAKATPLIRRMEGAVTKRQRRYSGPAELTPRKRAAAAAVADEMTEFGETLRKKIRPTRARKPNPKYAEQFVQNF